jgi:hypothetical protein
MKLSKKNIFWSTLMIQKIWRKYFSKFDKNIVFLAFFITFNSSLKKIISENDIQIGDTVTRLPIYTSKISNLGGRSAESRLGSLHIILFMQTVGGLRLHNDFFF